jgi:hypothetical protein
MIDEYGVFDGRRIDRGNQSTRTAPARVSFCPPQISHYFTQDRTQLTGVKSRESQPELRHGHLYKIAQNSNLHTPEFCFTDVQTWNANISVGKLGEMKQSEKEKKKEVKLSL